jgi:hypothetical protein
MRTKNPCRVRLQLDNTSTHSMMRDPRQDGFSLSRRKRRDLGRPPATRCTIAELKFS